MTVQTADAALASSVELKYGAKGGCKIRDEYIKEGTTKAFHKSKEINRKRHKGEIL